MLKILLYLVVGVALGYAIYHFYLYEEPSFPYATEEALLSYLNETCSKSDLALADDVVDWELTHAYPSKKMPDWGKEPVFTRTVKLEGYYLPAGKTAKREYVKFKTQLYININRTDLRNPVFKIVESEYV